MKKQSNIYRILIFSPEKPYTGAESIVAGKLMRIMMNHGWKVDLIFHETDLIYTSKSDTLSILNRCYGIENKIIKRLIRILKDIPVLKKIYLFDSILWIYKAFKLSIKLNRIEPYDLILSRIMPQYGHLPAYFFTKFNRKTPWIANWSDPMPRTKSPMPYGKGVGAKVNIIEMFYLKLIVKHANLNTFPSNRLMEYYQQYLQNFKYQRSVLPHVILENETDIDSQKYKDSKTFTVTHLGGFGFRNPTNLILAFNNIKNTIQPNVKILFRFIGYIDEYITEVIKQYDLQDYFSLEGLKSYEETLEAIKESDMMLVVEAPLKEGIFLPSKVMDYLQYHKPIFAISPANGVMNDLLTNYGGGRAADCTSIESIKDALSAILNEIEWVKTCSNLYNTDNLRVQFSEIAVMNELKRLINK